jgi:small-conductance mechanosensitive channel
MDDLNEILETLKQAWAAVEAQVATIWVPIQVVEIVLAALAGWAIAALVRKRIDLQAFTTGWPVYPRLAARAVIDNLGIIFTILLLLAIRAAMIAATVPSRSYLIGVAANLATAWVVISVLASVIHNQFVNRLVSVVAWSFAALSILGLIEPVSEALDSAGVVIGGLRITALVALKATALLLLTLWAATALSNFLDRRIRTVPDLTPSIQVLLGKLIRVALITFAVLIVLSSVGIDFSALALFSGAVGVGVGFGLQKIVSNLVSGIILLADKSIKPGDVITVGDSFGWVDTMGARYTSVVSHDGREFLIPNEDFVTQRVINWSYSNDRVRLEVPFGVSYASDPHRVCALAVEAVKKLPRVLTEPAPVCFLLKFGDSSLDFSLRFWIRDPIGGVSNMRSAALLALWDAFKREGIEIPFPQRDLNVGQPVRVVVERDGHDAAPPDLRAINEGNPPAVSAPTAGGT